MANQPPTVSVIIPTYYRNDLLGHAIESVRRQNYRPIEIIIVDDSGEEYAKPIATEHKSDHLSYIPLNQNRGQNAALNVGLDEATGKYVQFLDDDDEVIGEKFSQQVSLMESNDEIGVVYCKVKRDDGTISNLVESGHGDVLEQVVQFRLISCMTSSMLIRRQCLSDIAPLPTPSGSTDIYMKFELAQVTDFDYIREPGILKRDSEGSVGSSDAAIEGHKRIFEEYSDLYRQFPSSVRRSAVAKYHHRKASHILDNQIWDLEALWEFAAVAYYEPGLSLPHIGRFVGSLLGRPGVRTVEWCMSRLASLFER